MDKTKKITIQLTLSATIFLDGTRVHSFTNHDDQPEEPGTIAARIKKFKEDLGVSLQNMDQERVTVQLSLTAAIYVEGTQVRSITQVDDEAVSPNVIDETIKTFRQDIGSSLERIMERST